MLKLILAFVLIWVLGFNAALGEQRRILNTDNDFGGETIELKFEKEDGEYKLSREVRYLSREGKLRKRAGYRLVNEYNPLKIRKATEFYYQTGELEKIDLEMMAEKAAQIGYYRSITTYTKSGVQKMREFFYNQSDFDVMVYKKSIDYFSAVGEIVRSEFYLNDKEVEKTGFYKIVSYYEDGRVVKQEMYDTKGGVF